MNDHLPISLVKKLCEEFPSDEMESIAFCGNYGDPIAHPRKIEVFRMMRERFPSAFVVIHTNGGLASTEQWREIAGVFRGTPHRLRFAIDGLADTHPIYRRNVSFDSALRNAKEFIQAGGTADWKWIDFAHTRHQIDEARRLSRELGFASFSIGRDHSNFRPDQLAPSDTSYFHYCVPAEKESYPAGTVFEESNCRASQRKLIYMDVQGRIWPCCWVADGISSRYAWKRQALRGSIGYLPDRFNSLYDHSLAEITAHPFFDETLPDSWQKPLPTNCARICLFSCAQVEPIFSDKESVLG